MNYKLLKDVVDLVQDFEGENLMNQLYTNDLEGFVQWINRCAKNDLLKSEPEWEGKDFGRSPESVINTLIVHMNRYAKSYSKAAIFGSDFSTQEDFIYLINLKAFGSMSKMELIKKNIQDKPTGMKIIDRLIYNGWVKQDDSKIDKRSKVITIVDKGLMVLERQMGKIRKATNVVTGDLDKNEKMQLIYLLQKLDHFHKPLYDKNSDPSKFLEVAYNAYLQVI
ncbi:MarR family winged helix-turn-helix transcriptional regulator [Flavobacterium pectinovorum]|uniref:MarR family winged helix-turn-helix transcriptional regulator n=1 Tax=Flavobacterium pectinovorum TaxID=29533 RepID=UPI001FAE4AB2|nr:MarR family winged helix-turn-helix transcriptional regulator [Flavobacterium pectinovorum]MCI9844009.1 winged helix-turn-helix transcriptional regulator [Flavobacterium pectinovorum]